MRARKRWPSERTRPDEGGSRSWQTSTRCSLASIEGASSREPARRRNAGLSSGRGGGRRDDGRRPRKRASYFPGTRRLSTARLASPGKGVVRPSGRFERDRLQVCCSTRLSYSDLRRWRDSNPRHPGFSLDSDEPTGHQANDPRRNPPLGHRAWNPRRARTMRKRTKRCSRESNPRCSRQDSNLHRLSTPGLCRAAMPIRLRERCCPHAESRTRLGRL